MNNEQNSRENKYVDREPEVIYDFYGEKGFLKIKNRLLSIGKIEFAFVNAKNAKESNINFYMDALKFKVFIKNILNFSLAKKMEQSLADQKATKAQYPKEVWDSQVVPVSEGKDIFREFHIGPSILSTCYANFRAKQGKLTIFVPVVSYEELLEFAEKSMYIIDDYCKKMFTVEKTTSIYDLERSQKKQYQDQNGNGRAPSTDTNQQEKPQQAHNDVKEPLNEAKASKPTETEKKEELKPLTEEFINIKLKTTSLLAEKETYYYIAGLTPDGNQKTVIFLKEQINALKKEDWKKLYEQTSATRDIILSMVCKNVTYPDGKSRLYFQKFNVGN